MFFCSVIVFTLVFNYVCSEFVTYFNNPCPQTFQYFRNNGPVLGYLEFTNDRSGYYELAVNMSVAAYIGTNQNIRLELLSSTNDLISGKRVSYFIHFPTQEILPKPTRIVFNKEVYCTGPPEDLRPGVTVTNMWATTYFRLTAPISSTKPGGQFFLEFGAQPSTLEPFTLPTLPDFTHATHASFLGRPTPTDLGLNGAIDESFDSGQIVNRNPKLPSATPGQAVTPFTNPPVEQCGYSSVTAQNLVVNGKSVRQGEFPWLVAIMYRQNFDYRYRCTGSLISRRHVITAGHCVRYYQALLFPIEDFLLVLGKNNIRNWANDAVIRDVKNITVHPNYQQNKGDYDIAVLKLEKDVELSSNIRPVCIWQEDDVLDKVVGQHGTVVGWGKDEDESKFVPDAKSISLPIVSQVECLRSDPAFSSVTSARTFCAGRRDGTGPCTGDSGGGFFMNRNGRWTLRGVVSLSLSEAITCDTTKYFVFVDAAKLRDWIIASIA